MVKGTTNLSFKYNDSGIKTQKTVNGVTTKYYLNGDKVTLEDNGTDKIYYSYDAAGNLVSMNLNGTEYYYIRNAQGDITGLFNNAGTQVVSYTYDSWGKLILTTGTLASTVGTKNPYLYRGYRSDSETGLYYLQSRYYSPEWGRFVNADSFGGKIGELLSHNVFAYCGNNPVNNEDPTGRWFIPILFIPMVASAIASVVTYAVTWALGYHDFSWKNLATEAVRDATFGMIGGAVSEKIATAVVLKAASKKVVNKSVNNIIDNPQVLKEMKPKEVMNLAERDGWTVSPLGKGSLKGVPYSEGGGLSIRKIGLKGEPTDAYIQWHPGGGHHGSSSYWKVSSGKSGTIRIFGE